MTWMPPESETDWTECLSAYLDGELPSDVMRAVDDLLERTPERLLQLEELRAASLVLQEWTVDTPVPDAAFVQRLRREHDGLQPVQHAPMRRFAWQLAAACFALGLFMGVAGTLFANGESERIVIVQQTPVVPSETAISPEQAEQLFREAEAESLKEKIVQLLRARRYDAAKQYALTLMNDYGDTSAATALDNDPTVRALNQRLLVQRRTKS